MPRSSAKLWYRVSSARVHSVPTGECSKEVAARTDLSLPSWGHTIPEQSSQAGVQSSPAFLSVPAVLQAAKGVCLLLTGLKDSDTQSVTGSTHSPGQASIRAISLFLLFPPRAAGLSRMLFLLSYFITCLSF